MGAFTFTGFARPHDSFYRLPNDWFDILAAVRQDSERRRITSVVRLLEYIIKWTWGRLDFEGYIRLTFDELQHGKVTGRRGRQRLRADLGTGLPRSGLNSAIQDALAYGLLERLTDGHDAARVRQSYRVRLRAEDDEAAAESDAPFTGFRSPRANYFIVPKIWTDLISRERSDTLILAVEYFFRHCWGWRQGDETHWLTADEVAQGRIYRQSVAAGAVRRYDRGTGYSVDATRRALELGVERGWLSRTAGVAPSGWDAQLYTLRRHGWPSGDLPHKIWQDMENGTGDVAAPEGDLIAPISDVEHLPEPIAALFVPVTDASEPLADAVAPRTVLPTLKPARADGPNLPPPPRHTAPSRPGGEISDPGTTTVFVTLPHQRRIQKATGAVWTEDRAIAAEEVALWATPDGEDAAAIVIPLDTAAELLAGGMPPEQLAWELDETTDVEAKLARLHHAVRAAQRTQQQWGAASLQAALEQHGVARSTAAGWIARWGEAQVGGWLQALRADASVRSLPALLYTRLRAGDPPPALR